MFCALDCGSVELTRPPQVCVEPGLLGDDRPLVPPGHVVELAQTLEPLE